jgi:vacuolar-type H+-ATPase subunit I/STV1
MEDRMASQPQNREQNEPPPAEAPVSAEDSRDIDELEQDLNSVREQLEAMARLRPDLRDLKRWQELVLIEAQLLETLRRLRAR